MSFASVGQLVPLSGAGYGFHRNGIRFRDLSYGGDQAGLLPGDPRVPARLLQSHGRRWCVGCGKPGRQFRRQRQGLRFIHFGGTRGTGSQRGQLARLS